MYLKNIVDQLGIELDTISVDSERVKSALLSDTKYTITRVPALLLLYSNGTHRTQVGAQLDLWFEEVISAIQGRVEEHPGPMEVPQRSQPMREEETEVTSIGAGTFPISGGEVGTVLSSVISNDPMIQPERKEVKQAGPSAKELAEQMLAFRDQEEQIIENVKKGLGKTNGD